MTEEMINFRIPLQNGQKFPYGRSDIGREIYSSSSDCSDENEPDIHVVVCLCILTCYLCGGGLFSRELEKDWRFTDAFYFCFITLATIGLGDYVSSTRHNNSNDEIANLISVAFYLLFGMVLVTMSLNLIKESVADSVRYIGKKIGLVAKDGDKSIVHRRGFNQERSELSCDGVLNLSGQWTTVLVLEYGPLVIPQREPTNNRRAYYQKAITFFSIFSALISYGHPTKYHFDDADNPIGPHWSNGPLFAIHNLHGAPQMCQGGKWAASICDCEIGISLGFIDYLIEH